MEYKIKSFDELGVHELYEILKVRNQVYVTEQCVVYQDCDGKDKNGYHLFVENNAGDNTKNNVEVIAYLRILNKGVSYKEVSIGRVLVVENFRGNGFAKEMLKEAIRFVEEQLGEKEIRISAQKYLTKFYCDLGFKVVSEEYIEDDILHIEMFYSNK